jgi:hypothetical protein
MWHVRAVYSEGENGDEKGKRQADKLGILANTQGEGGKGLS